MRKYKQEPYTVPPWIYNAIQVLRPAERLTVSEWAAKYRILPDGNAIPGPWSNSVTPYLAEIMDAFSDDTVEEIVFVKPTQVGGTSAMENMLGSLIAQRPSEICIANRSVDKAQALVDQHASWAAEHGVRLSAHALQDCGRGFDVLINATSASLAGVCSAVAAGLRQ